MESFTYPRYVGWQVDLQNRLDANLCFGKKTSKKIQKTILLLEKEGYTFKTEPVQEELLKKFLPLYHKNISEKENPKFFDVPTELQKNSKKEDSQIEALSLYYGTTYVGGVIYRVVADSIKINYRVFQKELFKSFPITPSIVSDFFIYQKAIDLKKEFVTHGKDSNLYGLHSSIGLALFKIQSGCYPKVSKDCPIFFTRKKSDLKAEDTQQICSDPTYTLDYTQNFFLTKNDILVFLGEKQNEKIQKAILFLKNTDEETLKKYELLFNNPHFTTEIVTIGEQSPAQNPLLQNDREQ
jgi:hypothetical protein